MLIVLNTVGLTSSMLPLAPRLNALAHAGWSSPLREILPAVTCSAQATLLTGKLPQEHGIVGNGWLFQDTMEVRFWQQSNRLLQSEPIYDALKKRRPGCKVAKIFWWFNQGANVDISVTPKPHYGADGSKAFDIQTYPEAWAGRLKSAIGDFPFPTFWGPMAGLPSTSWIARAAAEVVRAERPDLTLVYLPHLDYEPQRLGPKGCDWPKLVGELDGACAPILDAAKELGGRVWVVNEYTHVQVDRPVLPNRALRQAGLLTARAGPFGEQLEVYASRAFAVCDHQIAHVYVGNPGDIERVRKALADLDGVDRIAIGPERRELGLDHPRAGDLVLLSKPNAWFAYPFWLDDRLAPDYARTVDIHRKPGYDPCELFFDPALRFPKLKAARKLLRKKLGFRTLFDVIPLDPGLVRGSHGLAVEEWEDRPVLIGDGPAPGAEAAMTEVHQMLSESV